MKKHDLTGSTFNRWTVIAPLPPRKRCTIWLCRCACGAEQAVYANHLVRGRTTQCDACKRTEGHGDVGTRLYGIWHTMKMRVRHSPAYKDKGLCDEWQDYPPFKAWALANGYKDNLSIDRKDGRYGYAPDNCRWATTAQQLENRSCTVWVLLNGKRMTLSEACGKLGIKYVTGYKRYISGHACFRKAPPIKSAPAR